MLFLDRTHLGTLKPIRDTGELRAARQHKNCGLHNLSTRLQEYIPRRCSLIVQVLGSGLHPETRVLANSLASSLHSSEGLVFYPVLVVVSRLTP